MLLQERLPVDDEQMSDEVPPTSQQSRLASPIAAPKCALDIVPAAGPEKTSRNGFCASRPRQQRRRAVGEVELAGEAARAQLAVELVRVAR